LHVTTCSDRPGLVVLYACHPRPSFEPKIKNFFSLLQDYYPWLATASVTIDAHNTFPHGAGIASSASSMSALALCLMDIHEQINGPASGPNDAWWQRVSEMARLGSGSACRSLYPFASIWGKVSDVPGSSDLFAIPWGDQLASIYQDYQDTILIVSSSEKSVSSTAGHALMNHHPYAEARYVEARQNFTRLIEGMIREDSLELFMAIVESEALQLHALMLSSPSPFMLLAPATLSIIRDVWQYRKDTGVPVCFTLDAGPNVHLLYPARHRKEIQEWIDSNLVQYCAGGAYIHDHVGLGPEKIS
jgi:diphosphomevalonate decarboxylase